MRCPPEGAHATRSLAYLHPVSATRGSGSVADTLLNRNSGLAEVVIPPRSPLIGQAMSPGMITESGDLVVLAIQRQGIELATAQHGEIVRPREVVLQAGDHLLLQRTWKALDLRLGDPEVLVVDSPDVVRRQAVPLLAGSQAMLAIVAAMVLVLATGIVPAAVGVLLAAMAVIGLRISRSRRPTARSTGTRSSSSRR